jgi:Phage integrase family
VGTIVKRPRKNGTTGHLAQIILKKDGRVVHQESQVFDRRQAAAAWIERREAELRKPGAVLGKARGSTSDPTLGEVIDRYIGESRKAFGRTKAQVLKTIKTYDIADMRCSGIGSAELLAFARAMPCSPQTVRHYLGHLGPIFKLAGPAWGYPLQRQTIQDALTVAKQLGVTANDRLRERRPTLAELDKLMLHFANVMARHPDSIPMTKIVAFAIFSTRRQEEITRIRWDDYEGNRVLVRDMKHPGDKAGNHTWCDLPPEASAIIDSMPNADERIFPYVSDSIGTSFARACKLLGIHGLRFHDLRHEGVSRLFEKGATIPQAASVSGHRSWSSLKRYSHLRQAGDKYAGWKWLGAE